MASLIEFLSTWLHGRRSGFAEGSRLEGLTALGTVGDLARVVCPSAESPTSRELQRRLLANLVLEMGAWPAYLAEAERRLVEWMPVRFQLENLKTLLRGWTRKTPYGDVAAQLIDLPSDLRLDGEALMASDSLQEFIRRLPDTGPREALRRAMGRGQEVPPEFFLEAALDRDYLAEYLRRASALPSEEWHLCDPMVVQEADLQHLRLVVRGRFLHGIEAASLRPFHVAGTRLPRSLFAAMLADADLRTAASRAVGRVIDELPSGPGGDLDGREAGELESLAWKRLARLAHRAFRRSHLGIAAVVAYATLRRVEIANLTLLSEGIRLGIAGPLLRQRLGGAGEGPGREDSRARA